MNPKGKWVFRNLEYQFINESIMALYGIVYPVGKGAWYWEARTALSAREATSSDTPRGFAQSEENAKEIVETLLRLTNTVEF